MFEHFEKKIGGGFALPRKSYQGPGNFFFRIGGLRSEQVGINGILGNLG